MVGESCFLVVTSKSPSEESMLSKSKPSCKMDYHASRGELSKEMRFVGMVVKNGKIARLLYQQEDDVVLPTTNAKNPGASRGCGFQRSCLSWPLSGWRQRLYCYLSKRARSRTRSWQRMSRTTTSKILHFTSKTNLILQSSWHLEPVFTNVPLLFALSDP